MGFLDAVTNWFRREARDVKDGVERWEGRADADLTRKERALDATPEERMESIQAETGADDALAEIQAKIDGAQAHAEARGDLIEPDAD